MKNIMHKIIFIFAAFFAAGFATSANAQQAEVYTQASGTHETSGLTLTLSDPLTDIATAARNSIRRDERLSELRRVNPADISVNMMGIGANRDLFDDLPTFGSGPGSGSRTVIKAGDLFQLYSALAGVGPSPVFTVYVRESDNALVLASSVSFGVANTNAGEFYLNDDWKETSDITKARGYVAPPPPPSSEEMENDGGDNDGNTDNTGGNSGGGGGSAGAIIGGVAVVGGLIWLLSSGGAAGEFNFTPDFGYAINESGYAANAGGRMDFRKDKWHLYYTGGQTNANGDFGNFRYSSGGKYAADFWTAAFSESVSGKTADYDFSLSANFAGEIWEISPVYHLHSRHKKDKTETHNALNLESVLHYNRWIIRPAAGFRWENANDLTQKLQINATHYF